MAEPTQFTFSVQEVTKALIKQQELREGKWVIALEFGFGAGLVGQTPDGAVFPTAFVAIQRVNLVRHPDNAPAHPLVTDAAEVNPRPPTAPEHPSVGRRRPPSKTTRSKA